MSRDRSELVPDQLLRRILLGVVTALLVARPLVGGEDPGRLHSPEAMSGVILNLLWFIAVGLGAVWLARSCWRLGRIDWVTVTLLVVSGLTMLSTAVVTCYRHPGWLIGWEWLALAASFWLVRTLAADTQPGQDTSGALIAVVLASAVSLAAYGIYQALAETMGLPVPELASQGQAIDPPGSEFLDQPATPILTWISRATFARPDTLAALLLLCLPPLLAYSIVGRGWRHRLGLVPLLIVAVGLVLALVDFTRSDWWLRVQHGVTTAWRMAIERPLLGVGPGNFDRHAPRLQSLELPFVLDDSGGAFTDLLATGGLPVLLALVVAFGLILWRRPTKVDPVTAPDVDAGPRWEFYLGGVVGLMLGLLLRLLDQPAVAPPQAILHASIGAVIRGLAWFSAFALLESTDWRSRLRDRSVLIGIGLVLFFGLISTAPLLPAVMQLLFALAAAVTVPVLTMTARRSAVRWVPVPILAGVVVANLLLVCDPVCQSAVATTESRRAARFFPAQFAATEAAPPGMEKRQHTDKLSILLSKDVLVPLRAARNADPYDILPHLEWAAWYLPLWKANPNLKQEDGIAACRQAAAFDPLGTAAPIMELQLRLAFARLDPSIFRTGRERRVDPKVEQHVLSLRDENLREAEALIERIAQRDPALEAPLRFRLAQTLVSLSDADRYKQGITQAVLVRELTEQHPGPRSQLSPDHTRQLQRWLGSP